MYENIPTTRLEAVASRINEELSKRQARLLLPMQAREVIVQAETLGVDPLELFKEVAGGFNAEDA